MFRRAYRMSLVTFYSLYQKIRVPLLNICNYNSKLKSQKFPHVPNGPIHPTVRLACAIRLYAGGEAVDIACTYNVSPTEVHNSLQQIMEAINSVADLKIEYPRSHEDQRKVADGFKTVSKAGIDSCAGCIDGMLVWILKPNEKECKVAEVDSGKFFCGRKHKFGLNLQAVCDHKKRFLNISILFPASCSDFIAFESAPLRFQMEEEGFLAPGLCLFGDNAYVNRFYMATPYPNVGSNSAKDIYNFYHSQLRINIECAFGILVSRWGILRKPLSSNFTMRKIVQLVECLCRLHNFIIDSADEPENPGTSTHEDNLNTILHGGFSVGEQVMRRGDGTEYSSADSPTEIMHGGEHFDDVDRSMRDRIVRRNGDSELPREQIYSHVQAQDLRRPVPRSY